MRKTCLECVFKLAQQDERVVFIGSDLGAGTLEDMRREIPDRWFMEGISEQYVVGMAAGLAMEGFIPYVNTIATFLTRRCYEQLVIDVCLHNTPVRLIGNGGGLVYAPLGPTHQAIDDLAIMRTIPNMAVIAPCDADEMRRLMAQTVEFPYPLYIRLAKGGDRVVSQDRNGFAIGKAIELKKGKDVMFITTGIMAQRALDVSEKLAHHAVSSGVLHVHTLKPFDAASAIKVVTEADLVVTLEEHMLTGGLGSLVLEVINDSGCSDHAPIIRMGLPDRFTDGYGSQDSLLQAANLDVESIVDAVLNKLLH